MIKTCHRGVGSRRMQFPQSTLLQKPSGCPPPGPSCTSTPRDTRDSHSPGLGFSAVTDFTTYNIQVIL